jgi:hypothetical protein
MNKKIPIEIGIFISERLQVAVIGEHVFSRRLQGWLYLYRLVCHLLVEMQVYRLADF